MTDYDPSTHGDVDIVFAGGGTAACVAAGRLSRANPDLKILLIEQGAKSFDNPAVRVPALYLSHLAPDSKSAIFYKAKSSKHLNGREAIVPCGGVLGGGSAINFMMYTRPQRIDYDSWNTPGWTANDLIPLSNKIETYDHDAPEIDKSNHGYSGPIHISDGGFRNARSEDEYMKTVKEMGREEIVDLQQHGQTGGFSRWQRYVSKDGNRQDSAYTYLLPLVEDGKHPNLFILSNTKVIRVLFDQSGEGRPRAVGVEYKPTDSAHSPSQTINHVPSTVKATKYVVVSAGALGTPQVLERSGVGSTQILEKFGIPVVSNLPGVGENYQDHNIVLYPYRTSLDSNETIDGILSGRQDFAKAAAEKNPILGWNAIDICSKIRMTDQEVKDQGADFQKDYERDFSPEPTRPLVLSGMINGFLGDPSLVEPGQYVTLGCYPGYPWSRGNIHINSTDDIINGYDFDAGFFSSYSDVKTQIWGYKITREIARRLSFCTGELELGHPQFKEGSQAKLSSSDYSTQAKTDLVYSAEDDAIIEAWVRDNVNTSWHSLGTCAMKPLEKGGVVDADLNVYGTQSLKLVDLSIAPENVGANTNNTALVIGEKAAVIIGRELGIAV